MEWEEINVIFRGVSCCFQTSYVLYAENESKQKKNEELKAENDELRTKISMMDETAICNLRKQKNTEIQRLRNQLTESRRTASYYEVIAEREKKRADNAEGQLNLTSSSCHPKALVKEFSYFLMPCHQHGLGVNLLVQR